MLMSAVSWGFFHEYATELCAARCRIASGLCRTSSASTASLSRMSRLYASQPSTSTVSFGSLVTMVSQPQSCNRCSARYRPTNPPPPMISAFMFFAAFLQFPPAWHRPCPPRLPPHILLPPVLPLPCHTAPAEPCHLPASVSPVPVPVRLPAAR